MPVVRVTASTVVQAPADVVYDLIADYQTGHPGILPPQYFEKLVVEAGGRGAGTRIRFTMKSYGTRRESRARVTEPQPGRVLVETDEDTGTVTTFTIDPLNESAARVTFDTEYKYGGVRGWLESRLVPGYLRKVYAAELALVRERATAAVQARNRS